MLSRFFASLALLAGILFVDTPAPAQNAALSASQRAGKSWIFDSASYTNNPKTGERVWQFTAPKPVYRDPNALYDSPHGAYPFEPDVYDPYLFYGPYLYYGAPLYARPEFHVPVPASGVVPIL